MTRLPIEVFIVVRRGEEYHSDQLLVGSILRVDGDEGAVGPQERGKDVQYGPRIADKIEVAATGDPVVRDWVPALALPWLQRNVVHERIVAAVDH